MINDAFLGEEDDDEETRLRFFLSIEKKKKSNNRMNESNGSNEQSHQYPVEGLTFFVYLRTVRSDHTIII
jgi:hypothetical protein